MGQHNRTVTCATCPASAPLKVAKASWKARVGRGRNDTSPATWICPTCVERQRRPAPSLLSSIKLKPRQPSAPAPSPARRSMPALRGRMQIIAAAAMLGLVGMPMCQRRDFSWLADLRILMHTQGSPCIGTISTNEAAQLGDHETIEAMCENGLTVVALPTHPQTYGGCVAVEIRIA